MQNGRKICGTIGICFIIFMFVLSGTAIAKSSKEKVSKDKATGEVGYEAYGLHRSIEFSAHEQSENCECSYSLLGEWTISVNFNGSLYNHDMSITNQEEDGVLTGNGAYPAGGPYSITWELANSWVDNRDVYLELDYNNSEYVAMLEGIISPDGTMSGTWSSNVNQRGIWNSTAGTADTIIVGCEGKGMHYYSDDNGNWYYVDVQYVNVAGETAWFAGPVTSASNLTWTGFWLFAKVKDGGEPAAGVDQVWGSFTSMSEAKVGVVYQFDPSDGPFSVESGNLQVHTY